MKLSETNARRRGITPESPPCSQLLVEIPNERPESEAGEERPKRITLGTTDCLEKRIPEAIGEQQRPKAVALSRVEMLIEKLQFRKMFMKFVTGSLPGDRIEKIHHVQLEDSLSFIRGCTRRRVKECRFHCMNQGTRNEVGPTFIILLGIESITENGAEKPLS